MIKEMQNIFHEKDFIDGINYRSKYGVSLKSFTEEQLNKQVLFYVECCMDIQDFLIKRNAALRPFYIDLYLFVQMFCDIEEEKLNSKDIIAKAYLDYKNGADDEAGFLKKYFKAEIAAVL
ncbi:MAG: hypothetical protein Q4F11_04135 [Eubacteriales bacterium]|nr:hypothetical protein [Eubacteriales bacterium]